MANQIMLIVNPTDTAYTNVNAAGDDIAAYSAGMTHTNTSGLVTLSDAEQATFQEAANIATRKAILDYDQRHGWRGVEDKLNLQRPDDPAHWQELLRPYRAISGLQPALVVEASPERAVLALGDGQTIDIGPEQIAWMREYLSENRRGETPRQVDQRLAAGDVVRVSMDAEGQRQLSQLPKAQGTRTAIEWETGAVRALTGGFSFQLNKFNRATQAQRQPGSSFKPFIYAAAFERGFTPASIVLDAPVVFNDRGAGKVWRPQNDNEEFAGPMRLREAMVTSRNLVSVRVLDAIGVGHLLVIPDYHDMVIFSHHS